MFRNRTHTILLITRDELLRADVLRGSSAALSLCRAARPAAVDDLATLVEAALRLSTARPGQVWVLSTEIWTQTIALAAQTVAGLEPQQLARALGFEAEPLSNIRGVEARAACVPVSAAGNERVFWTTILPEPQLQQIELAVERGAGRLAGVAHPGGLPSLLAAEVPAAPAAWRRVELWPGAIVCLSAAEGRELRVHVVNSDPRPDRWRRDLESWDDLPADGERHEWLHATAAIQPDELPADDRVCLAEPDSARRFLAAWGAELSAGPARVPVIRPAKRPMSVATRRTLAAVAAALCLAACVGHYLAVESIRGARAAETARLRRPAEQLAQLKKDGDQLRTQRDKLRTECDRLNADMDNCRRVMLSQRKRVAQLLAVLARQDPDQLVLEKITGSGDHVVLYGLSLRPEAVNALAKILNSELGPLGWQVQVPNEKAREMLSGGGPWQFEVHIQDITPPAAGKPATVKSGKPEVSS
jgi:Tfp pilus assembly protein PilN